MTEAKKMYCYNSGWGKEFLWACGTLKQIKKTCLQFSEAADAKFQISARGKLPSEFFQEPIPSLDDIGELATGSIKNLHSALDHSVTFLREVSDRTPMISNSENAFPICSDLVEFNRVKKRALVGLDNSFVSRIESIQPFSNPSKLKLHPLEFLKLARHLITHRATINCLNPLTCDRKNGRVHVVYNNNRYFWDPMIQLEDGSLHSTCTSIVSIVDYLWRHVFTTGFFGANWDQTPSHMIGHDIQFKSSTTRLF